MKSRILDTPGVLEIINYYSTVDADRHFNVVANVSTVYGVATVTVGG